MIFSVAQCFSVNQAQATYRQAERLGPYVHFFYFIHRVFESINESALVVVKFNRIFFSRKHFFKYNGRHKVLFVGSLIPLFWTSGDVCPRFQSLFPKTF